MLGKIWKDRQKCAVCNWWSAGCYLLRRCCRDHVAGCSERTVLSCREPVCLCWRRFGRYFSHHLAKSDGWPADFYALVSDLRGKTACLWLVVYFFILIGRCVYFWSSFKFQCRKPDVWKSVWYSIDVIVIAEWTNYSFNLPCCCVGFIIHFLLFSLSKSWLYFKQWSAVSYFLVSAALTALVCSVVLSASVRFDYPK